MSSKRKWEIGASLSLAAVLFIAVAFCLRLWLLNEALVKAVWGNDANEVRRLLRRGADRNHHDRQYHQPMVCYAVNSGATLKVLLQGGANPNAPTKDEELSIVRAAAASYHDVVQILLRFGADVDRVDRGGNTALMAAARAGESPALVRTLLAAGAEVMRKDGRGDTAVDMARKRLAESGIGIGEKWRADVTRRQRSRRSEILRLLLNAQAEQRKR